MGGETRKTPPKKRPYRRSRFDERAIMLCGGDRERRDEGGVKPILREGAEPSR